jgi:putative ABC transport system permease protein
VKGAIDLSLLSMAAVYALCIVPLAIILWNRAGLFGEALVALVRMTLQLLFVGLYLQFVFKLNSPWLNAAWLVIMILVADVSVARRCGLRLARFALPLFVALLAGLAIPLLYFLGPILGRPQLLDAQYAIPLGGMILGNCLRADIIGLKSYYESIRTREREFLHALAQGATLSEATRPYLREALKAALSPTVATIATIGLVALPGMMTGVILGGTSPMVAIKYQIAIMVAILTGTAITVLAAIWITTRSSFTAYGVLDESIFKKK